MSARRIGFGDEDQKPPKQRAPAEAGPADAGDAPDAKEMSRFGKTVLAAFLLAWLVGWTIGMVEMGGNMPAFYARGDWFSLGFGLIWLTFGGVGWLFAVVILLAVLFGKKRDSSRPSRLQSRKAARAAARAATVQGRSRD